ncbi:MAG: histidine phosphatase family protein [Bacteroidetes bacterium]|nr:histidine phosphatase family protein [Bacteroidota bacterium]
MKTLLLIRHAKSSWDNPAQSDFDRTLNERGKKDAPAMAERLYYRDIALDAIISSPAKRAKKTAEYFAKQYDLEDKIIFKTELYLAETAAFFSVIEKLNDKYNCIAVFSHNPGITDFANQLTIAKIDDMPTCSIFAVELQSKHWADIRNAEKDFLFFDYPKALPE